MIKLNKTALARKIRPIILNLSSIVKSGQAKTLSLDNTLFLYQPDFISNFDPLMFDSDYWHHKNAITGQAQGRGTTWFIAHDSQDWVLRHYYRGGLIGKIIHDSYLFTGLENTRAIKEYLLLAQMQNLQLPAPQPVACKIARSGLGGLKYRADILSSRITNASDLISQLQEKRLNDEIWCAIGETIALFHHHGIYHHDLNIHNILIDDKGKVWLIDFDQGEQRKIELSWQKENIARLQRSFVKEKGKFPQLHWHQGNWETLLAAYDKALSEA